MCEIPVVEWGDVEKVKVKYFWHDNRDSYSWLFSTIFAVIIEVSPQHRDNNFAVEDRRMGEPRSCWPACIGSIVIIKLFLSLKLKISVFFLAKVCFAQCSTSRLALGSPGCRRRLSSPCPKYHFMMF